MGIIYLIENDLNDKKYVGLTTRNLKIRWKEHERGENLLIDQEIQKYGAQHFFITELEECNDEQLDDREKYWIKYYNSYNDGYNRTIGGRDKNMIFDDKNFLLVKKLWHQGLGQKAISQQTKLNIETVHNYLIKNHVSEKDIRTRANRLISLSKSKPVLQFDLNNNFIKEWNTAVEAAEAFNTNAKYITATCRGRQKTCQNMIWKYKGEENG